MSLRSPMSRVLGLGAAKEGSGHWWSQRVSAVALVALTLWFVAALLYLGTFDYSVVLAWARAPLPSLLLVLLVATAVYHSLLGVQVVIEDYVEGGARMVALMLSKFLHIAVGALGVLAVLRIALGGAA
jgi:succinate dehydrogenase / fumarate reductase, membrane anchor subunit